MVDEGVLEGNSCRWGVVAALGSTLAAT